MVNAATLPAKLLATLDLHEGDKDEGTVHHGQVTLHVSKRAVPLDERAAAMEFFLATWAGKFAVSGTADEARLRYLTQKHLR